MLFFVPLLSNLALCLLHAQNGSLHEKNRKRGFWDWEKRDGLFSLWGGGELQTSGFNVTATMNKEHGSAEGSTSGTESWIQLCCFFIITTQLESQDPCLDWVEFLLHPAGIPMPWSRRKTRFSHPRLEAQFNNRPLFQNSGMLTVSQRVLHCTWLESHWCVTLAHDGLIKCSDCDESLISLVVCVYKIFWISCCPHLTPQPIGRFWLNIWLVVFNIIFDWHFL